MKEKVIVGTVTYLHPNKKFTATRSEPIYAECTSDMDKRNKATMNEAIKYFADRIKKHNYENKHKKQCTG